MKSSIRILHLEDNPLDAELIRDRLETEGLACEIKLADRKAPFEAALEQTAFDLILCDHNLSDYDGFAALTRARARQPATPVIVISGSLGEEQAIRCLHLGATDYLLKQRLERLPSAVKRALAEAEGHRQRAAAETALRESEERFRQWAEHSSEVFWFHALNPPRLLYLSAAVEKVWGLPAKRFYEDPRAWLAAIHPDDRARLQAAWEAFAQGQTPRFDAEYRVVRPDGTLRWVLDSGTAIRDGAGEVFRLAGTARDITERKEAERSALRAQRLESIGTLASGIAHDLNNALSPILMATTFLRQEFPGAANRYLELIEAGTLRGAGMVKQLLSFAKGAEGQRLLVQPRHLLNEMASIIRATFPKNIQVQTSTAKELYTVLGDATQLHQVLLNLCVNARDAMPQGGQLSLVAENAELDAAFARTVPEARPGRYVVCRVKDTGTGIPPEVLDRMFEPFFTTKGPDKGTGLGLSTVLGIVKGHGGFIQVHSVPGQGSTFTVFLPASDASAAQAAAHAPAETHFRGQGETVLVVDDEPAVREVIRRLLEPLGLKVLVATDGTDGLAQAAAHRAELSVVITDLHMPQVDGLTLVRVLKRLAPEVKVIIFSGRLEEPYITELTALGVSVMLDKPFAPDRLVAALRTVLQK